MLLQRARAQRQSRAAGAPQARPSDFPLPLKGFDARAAEGNMPASVAAALHDLRPVGPKIALRPPLEFLTIADPSVLQRIPLEFGSRTGTVQIRDKALFAGTESLFSSSGYAGDALSAAISGNVIIADSLAGLSRYDGAAFHRGEFTGADGRDVSTLDGVIAHHDRVFAWNTGGDPDFFYGGVGAVMGELSHFPLSRLGNVTGRLLGMLSLSRDGGAGPSNALAIFTSTGLVVIYEGLNPADPADWRLVGRYQTVAPRARLGFAQVGGDVWMLTTNGVVPLSAAMRGSVEAMTSPLSDPIADELRPLLARPGGTWSLTASPEGDFVVVNGHDGSTARQWIYDTRARAWWTSSMPIRSFHASGGRLRFTTFDGREGAFLLEGGTERIRGIWQSGWIDLPGKHTSLASIEVLVLVDGEATIRLTVRGDDGLVIPRQDAKVGQVGQVAQRARYAFSAGITSPRVRVELELEATRGEILGLSASTR